MSAPAAACEGIAIQSAVALAIGVRAGARLDLARDLAGRALPDARTTRRRTADRRRRARVDDRDHDDRVRAHQSRTDHRLAHGIHAGLPRGDEPDPDAD